MTSLSSALALVALFTLPAVPVAATAEPRDEALAEIRAASEAWIRTCKDPGPFGLCVEMGPPPEPSQDTCGVPRLGTVVVTSRGKLGTRAGARLEAAVRDAEAAEHPDDDAAYEAELARARLLLADRDLETYLQLHMPTSLEFFVDESKRDSERAAERKQYARQVAKKEASTKAFIRFFKAKTEQGSTLSKQLAAATTATDPEQAVVAALKSAWVMQSLADELSSAPLPKQLRKPDLREAYCGALQSQARTPETMAKDALEYCINVADEHGLTTPAVDACEALAGRYPASRDSQ